MAKYLEHDLHPLVISIYPALSLLAVNIGQVNWQAGIRAGLISFLTVLLLLITFRKLLKSSRQASLYLSMILVLFFSYGHVYSLLKTSTILNVSIGRHRYLFPAWMAIGLLLAVTIHRKKPGRQTILAVNLGSSMLVALPAIALLGFGFQTLATPNNPAIDVNRSQDPSTPEFTELPSIFYIILDEYPREDTLASEYDFDNTSFINELKELGFAVASKGMSNYGHTDLSLASSLNFNYLPTLVPGIDPRSDDRQPMWALIQNSLVREYFEKMGYTISAFETGYAWSQWEDADEYNGPSQGYLSLASLRNQISDFEVLLLRQTALLFIEDAANRFPDVGIPRIERRATTTYDQVIYILETLPDLAARDEPTFVFAHLLVPHPPYTYSSTGVYIGDQILEENGDRGEALLYTHNIEGHRRSVEFISARILEVIEEVLAASSRDPIIILQSDTGPPGGSREIRMSILNALRLPGYDYSLLPETLTPVNTFRIAANHLFDAEFELLDDIAYYSTYNKPYDFAIIPSQ